MSGMRKEYEQPRALRLVAINQYAMKHLRSPQSPDQEHLCHISSRRASEAWTININIKWLRDTPRDRQSFAYLLLKKGGAIPFALSNDIMSRPRALSEAKTPHSISLKVLR